MAGSLFSGRESDATVGRESIADTAGAGAHSAPARAPTPRKRRHSEGDVDQLLRRDGRGVLGRQASDSSPRDKASEMLSADGTLWKCGAHA